MNSSIIVIHSSEIVRQGLFHMLKDLFGIEAVLLAVVEELKNFNGQTNSRLIILIDGELDYKSVSKTIQSFQKNYSEKIIRIHTSSNNCDCQEESIHCFSIHTSKSRIFDLLNPYRM